MVTKDLDYFKFQLADPKTSIAESINWRHLHLSDGSIKTIKWDNLTWHVWLTTGAIENCQLLALLFLLQYSHHPLLLFCSSLENYVLGWKTGLKNAWDAHLHITAMAPRAPFSCWSAGFQVRQRVIGDKTTDNAEGHCTEDFEFPRRQAPLGPGRDPPWGWKSQMIPSHCAPPFLPRHKRQRWLTPQTALESLTTIFNFKQATHKSWSLLLQTQPLGNHCLADINSLVTVKLPLKNATYFTPCPLTLQSRAWATWSKSRSGPALIPKLSISANSMRNVRPEVRIGRGEGQEELLISY